MDAVRSVISGLLSKIKDADAWKPLSNFHTTVKPIALMRYLARLTRTPTGGVVLDPFMGSGSTGCGAVLEGRDFIGIEQDDEYAEIARRRLEHWAKEHIPADNGDLPLFSQEE